MNQAIESELMACLNVSRFLKHLAENQNLNCNYAPQLIRVFVWLILQ